MQLIQVLTNRGTQLVMLGVDNSGRNWNTWSRHLGTQLIQFPDRGPHLILPLLQWLDYFHPPPSPHPLPLSYFPELDLSFGTLRVQLYNASQNVSTTVLVVLVRSILQSPKNCEGLQKQYLNSPSVKHWLWASLDLVLIFLGETNRRFVYIIMSDRSSYISPVILIQHLHSH
jgi:hypothetical protein